MQQAPSGRDTVALSQFNADTAEVLFSCVAVYGLWIGIIVEPAVNIANVCQYCL